MAIDWSMDRRGLFAAAAAAVLGGALTRSAKAEETGDARPVSFVSAARIGGNDGGVFMGADGLAPFALPARAPHRRSTSIREALWRRVPE